jgi:organic radical activating enzyme
MSQGYVEEIFSSFQGEGAAIEGSCYGLRQIFVRFSGCPLALGVHGTKGCVWCDSPKSWNTTPKKCQVETQPGSQMFEEVENPLKPEDILNIVKKLSTKDLHSISFTGGEPLHQENFLEKTIKLLKANNYKIYLETAYTDNFGYLKNIANKVDYACVDIKDRTAEAALDWEKLINQELQMCEILRDADSKVFAKTVITKSSKEEDFETISRKCGDIDVPIVIQLVSPTERSKVEKPTWDQVNKFAQIAGKYLPAEKIGISIQMHKAVEIL